MPEVKIKVGKENLDGLLIGDELILSNDLEVGDSINIDGKDVKVLETVVDTRDNVLKVKLAKASKSKEKKSDDSKQVKGWTQTHTSR